MGVKDDEIKNCLEMFLDFLKNANSVKALDIIIDICDQIRSRELRRDVAEQKFMKVMYNLKNSKTFDSLLEEKDRNVLNSLLGSFLDMKCDSNGYYIGNRYFSKLSLEELYNLFIEAKYLKEKELHNRKEEAVY